MRVISGFRREVDENYALLCSYEASSGNFLTAFRDNLSIPPSMVSIRNVDNKLPLLAAFLRPRAKTQSVPKIHVALHASHAVVPMLPTFRHNSAVSPDAHFLPCAAYCQQSTSQRLTLQPTFTRRTSGHSLGNFTEVNFWFVPHSPDSLTLSLSVAIFKASGITSAHCHSAARRKTTPDAANCYAERHHSRGTCCVYSAETTTLRNYHSSNTTKNASRLQTAVSVSVRIPTIHTPADAAQLTAPLMAVTSCLRTILMLRHQIKRLEIIYDSI
jgi:hypothetical protein